MHSTAPVDPRTGTGIGLHPGRETDDAPDPQRGGELLPSHPSPRRHGLGYTRGNLRIDGGSFQSTLHHGSRDHNGKKHHGSRDHRGKSDDPPAERNTSRMARPEQAALDHQAVHDPPDPYATPLGNFGTSASGPGTQMLHRASTAASGSARPRPVAPIANSLRTKNPDCWNDRKKPPTHPSEYSYETSVSHQSQFPRTDEQIGDENTVMNNVACPCISPCRLNRPVTGRYVK